MPHANDDKNKSKKMALLGLEKEAAKKPAQATPQQLHKTIDQLSAALKQSQTEKEHAELIYRVIPSAFFTVDKKGFITSWNRKAESITGYKQAEVLGQHGWRLLFGQDSTSPDNYQKTISCSIKTKNGRTRIISRNIEALLDASEKVIGKIISFHDITQQQLDQQQLKTYKDHLEDLVRVRTSDLSKTNNQLQKEIQARLEFEEELRRSQEKYQLLAENLQETVFRISTGGFIQYISGSIQPLADYGAEELEGFWIGVLFENPEEYDLTVEKMRKILQQKTQETMVFKLRKKHGESLYAEMTATPLIKDEEVISIQGAIRDITDRVTYETNLKKAKEAAEEANKAKSTFLSTISHEIRTPLHCIMGFAELINTLQAPKAVLKFVDSIINESTHLISLINMLLDHAKIEAGKLDLVKMPFSLHQLAREMDPLMRSMAIPKPLTISVEIGETVPEWIIGDSMRLRQILMNIVGNAVKFTHEGSVKLSIQELHREGMISTLQFITTDTGVGIPADKIESIFNSFTQVDGRICRKYGGTGLGTTITKQLVGLMNGNVKLESIEGAGTTFYVFIPFKIASKAEQEVAIKENLSQQESDTIKNKNHRILVAEDNKNGQLLIRMHLESVGHQCDIANNGREAVELYAEKSYDLVITDIQMPEMNGFRAAEAIRKQEDPHQYTPILAMTANADTATRKRCMDAGMDDVLTKPLRRKALLENVEHWLINRRGSTQTTRINSDTGTTQTSSTDNINKTFSYPTALQEFAGNKGILLKAIEHYMTTTQADFRSLREAYIESDLEKARKLAHKLRGSSGNVTAMELHEIAGRMESRILNEKHLVNLDKEIAQWEQGWEKLKKCMNNEPELCKEQEGAKNANINCR